MRNPKVSVFIPAYNHEKYIGETIQSVLDQTFQDFELIIINDGSTDHTGEEILKFQDDRIRYYSQENRGLTATLNRGIELAQGEYFNFLPSDDVFLPEKLEIQLEAFGESEDIGVVFSYQHVIDGEGREVKDDPIVDWFTVSYKTKEEIFPALFERDFLSVPTALIKTECFKRVGLFDESLKTAQDYDLWMRILKDYDMRLVKKPLLKLRWHGENLTYRATPETELERAKVLFKAYKDLTIEDIFPSLHQKMDATAYAEAYEKLASYMERSGLPALFPISKIYQDCAKAMQDSKGEFLGLKQVERIEKYDFGSFKIDDKKINVLIETPSLDKGGMEEAIYGIVTHLDPELFSPVIVCIEKGGYTADRIKKLGIPVEILGGQKGKEYLEILRRYQIDLVNSHFSFFGPVIAHRKRIPVISVLHTIYNWYPGSLLDEFRVTDQYISKYIAVSNQVASFFQYRFNIRKDRIKSIPDGINIKRFESIGDLEKLSRKDLGLDEEDFIFLHVGAVNSAKMHNLLAAAMKEVSKIQPKIKLLSIGPLLDQDYYDFIQKKIEEYHLNQQMRLIGFVENPAAYYRLADAFLLPSLFEGWGIATVEAMYYGLPLILTKVGGAEELIQNQDIGILIENCCKDILKLNQSDWDYYSHLDYPENTPELIETMLKVYRDGKIWKEKAKKGVEKVISHYSWSQITPQYEKEFMSLSLGVKRGRESFLQRMVNEQKERLNEQNKVVGDLKRKLGEQTKEMREHLISLTTGFQQQFDSMNHQLAYILVRLSITERIKERFFKVFKTIHRFVPKKIREKYRFQYRRFFFDKVFPDQKGLESSTPSFTSQTILSKEELDRFLEFLRKGDPQKLFVIYTTDPYIETRGQRSTWLAKEFSRRGFPIIFFYWRWDQKEEIIKSLDPHILSVPIDEFPKVEKQLFSFSSDRMKKIFLIEFPDGSLFEKVNIANVNSFITVYDCIDDWEQFAEAGQAIWYEEAIERYIVRNTDLVFATNLTLAERLKQMGATYVPIIPNGVDLKSFTQRKGLHQNVVKGTFTIGYFGHLTDSWFDWNLIFKTASRKKDWVFHLIGYGEPSDLTFPENVKFWGKVEHYDLPKYTSSWDVAIIPFKEGRLTEAVDPIKLYEYLFLRLPVVATNMFHLQGIPGVFPCKSSDFEETLILAKETPLDWNGVENFIQNNSWEKRVDRILEEIERVDLSKDILKGIG